jgi:hypothetical protein
MTAQHWGFDIFEIMFAGMAKRKQTGGSTKRTGWIGSSCMQHLLSSTTRLKQAGALWLQNCDVHFVEYLGGWHS